MNKRFENNVFSLFKKIDFKFYFYQINQNKNDYYLFRT